jgi:hypothetical protein
MHNLPAAAARYTLTMVSDGWNGYGVYTLIVFRYYGTHTHTHTHIRSSFLCTGVYSCACHLLLMASHPKRRRQCVSLCVHNGKRGPWGKSCWNLSSSKKATDTKKNCVLGTALSALPSDGTNFSLFYLLRTPPRLDLRDNFFFFALQKSISGLTAFIFIISLR